MKAPIHLRVWAALQLVTLGYQLRRSAHGWVWIQPGLRFGVDMARGKDTGGEMVFCKLGDRWVRWIRWEAEVR